jgi:cytochrome oxidase assembly protein ShyY1
MGVLLTVFLILLAMNLWTGISLKNKRAELAEIIQKIEQSPLEAKALAQVEVVERDGVIYIATIEGVKADNYSNKTSHVLKIGK